MPDTKLDPDAPSSGRSWTRFFSQLQRDLKLYLFLVVLLGAIRVVLVLVFADHIRTPVGVGDYLAAFMNGARFDLRVAGYMLIPCFLLTLVSGFWNWSIGVARFRLIWGSFLFLVTIMLGSINLGFIREYHDQFNHWIWGLVYDDIWAIMRTIEGQYPLVLMLLGLTIATTGAVIVLRRWLRHSFLEPGFIAQHLDRPWKCVVTFLLIGGLLFGAMRGSFGRRPVQIKDAAITIDPFLNKLVLNPFTALRYAIKDHLRLLSSKGLKDFLPDANIRAAVDRVFPIDSGSDNLSERLQKITSGWTGKKPRHIFVIVMESFDSWPLLPRYQSLHLCDGVAELGSQGIMIDGFVPPGRSTGRTLAALMSGVPSAGVLTNYRETSRQPYPTSVAPIFEKLGFKTRFFYGGYLSWHRIGSFATDQGFDEVRGGSHFGTWIKGNEWGVDDEVLFDRISKNVSDDVESFNLVMSTTNHPPYDIDVRALGFPLEKIPDDLAELYDGKVSMDVLGHLWYSDRCVSRFIREMEKKLTQPLFVIIGDHWSRMFLNTRPPYYAMRSTPCVIYGPEVLRGVPVPQRTAGSGNDIAPTLIEMSAPPNFIYHSFGRNMLAPEDMPVGYGYGSVIGADFIIDVQDSKQVHAIPGRTPHLIAEPAALVRRYQDLHGIAWWLLMRGTSIEGGTR